MTVYRIKYDYDVTYKKTPWFYHTKKGTRLVKTSDKINAATVLKRFMSKKRPKSLKGLMWNIVGHLTTPRCARAIIFAPKNSSQETNWVVVKKMKSA